MTDTEELERWIANVTDEERPELEALRGDAEAVTDAFYQDLSFGTAGLRGVVGLGSNRMNVYTVGRATQGLADYLNETYGPGPDGSGNCDVPLRQDGVRPRLAVALCRDSRHGGEEFVRTAAGILAANGIHAYVYPRIEPTPALSFATRDLACAAGINITASHNPAEYNGYKVYGPDGCQITSEAADRISAAIERIDYFTGVKKMDFDEAIAAGLVSWTGDDVLERFLDAVYGESLADGEDAGDLKLVYTPLNGTGLECVSKILDRIGVTDISVVPEQAEPDGDFPTCPYPNPEFREALERGIELSEQVHPDLLLATDPDADRLGTAVKDGDDYTLISGNEMGVLLLDYVAQRRAARGEDLSHDVAVTTIVSSTMVDALAREYGFELRRTLTGFKYIGEQIGKLESVGEASRFIFGFEESYGYMAGTHVRDKDAVVASMLVCEMAEMHKRNGRNLAQAIRALYEKYGWYRNRTISIAYPGAEGAERMAQLMSGLRCETTSSIGGLAVTDVVDYEKGAPMPVVNGHPDSSDPAETPQMLPPANVIEFALEGGNKLIIRPSGTEPKIKAYLFAKGRSVDEADAILDKLEAAARLVLE
jgi:phosphoglucomutase